MINASIGGHYRCRGTKEVRRSERTETCSGRERHQFSGSRLGGWHFVPVLQRERRSWVEENLERARGREKVRLVCIRFDRVKERSHA